MTVKVINSIFKHLKKIINFTDYEYPKLSFEIDLLRPYDIKTLGNIY